MPTWVLDPDITIDDPEVRAVVLETDIKVYVHLTGITRNRCANCHGVATAIKSSLDGRTRVFLCESCRTVA